MKITVRVHPGSSRVKVIQISKNEYEVWVTARAKEGEANKEVILVMAEYLHKPKSLICMTAGKRGRDKILEVVE